MAATKGHTGEALRTLRKAAGLTLSDVARMADTAPAYLSKVECGALIPAEAYVGRVMAAIARAFNPEAVAA
ncbi:MULTISPECIES: helix-turn-helix domain-containing protein [unclassified Microbacterium]|uniref:helix-turn-helix domain-containing protein n=1 Tax=unclassified Microbacterium TaxID=2609290 RepID=UPI00341FDF0E